MSRLTKSLLILILPLSLASWACLNVNIGDWIGNKVQDAINQAMDSLQLDELQAFADWVKENADKVSNVHLVEDGFAFDVEADMSSMAASLRAIAATEQLPERVDLTESSPDHVKLVFEGNEVGKGIVMLLTQLEEGQTSVQITVEDLPE